MVITRRPTIDLASSANRRGINMLLRRGSKLKCGSFPHLIKGLVLTITGILFTIWTPLSLFMDERLRMHKGLPPFEWWASPPDAIQLRTHVFNYTNLDRFLEGIDDKLHVQDIGPFIYKELLTHKNITFNANSTITYIATHTAKYIPELNVLNLNDTITVPNYALLSMVAYLRDTPFFTKFGFNMMARQMKTPLYRRMTIQDFLWNFTDPILQLSHSLIPGVVPVTNMGMLERIYEDFSDVVTMYMGQEYGDSRFGLINNFDYRDSLPNYKNCQDKISNSTEGVLYGQSLTRESIMKYWRKTICKVVNLYYDKDVRRDGLDLYKYSISEHEYYRTFPEGNDCYKSSPSLPNGLSDVSSCYYDVPIAASHPHYLYGDEKIKQYVTGLEPQKEKHHSYIIVEPISGVPFESVARSQSNLVLGKLSGFGSEVGKFTDLSLPMFWVEYNQNTLPRNVFVMVYFVAAVLPPLQIILIATLYAAGFMYVIRFAIQIATTKKYEAIAKAKNNQFLREQESFLKGDVHKVAV